MKAEYLETGKECAIKLIVDAFKTPYAAIKTYREIKIMRKFSEIKENLFIPQLYDIIFPECI